jgi:hypothetical protein
VIAEIENFKAKSGEKVNERAAREGRAPRLEPKRYGFKCLLTADDKNVAATASLL